MTEALRCAKAPCKSCPYRKDVPSGVWSAIEYNKLPEYDGSILDQVMTPNHRAGGIFMCHQNDVSICAGWVGTHGAGNLLALRVTRNLIDPSVWSYESPVPLFASGAQAAEHGKKSIRRPSERSKRMVKTLLAQRERKKS